MKIVKQLDPRGVKTLSIGELVQGHVYRWIGHADRTIFIQWASIKKYAFTDLNNGDNWDGFITGKHIQNWKFVELDVELTVRGDLK